MIENKNDTVRHKGASLKKSSEARLGINDNRSAGRAAQPIKTGTGASKHSKLFVERKNDKPFPLAVLFGTFKTLIIIFVLVGCMGFGLVLGVAKAYIDTTPDLDISRLTMSDRTTYIYDRKGNVITTYAGMEYRDWADIDEIPDMLKNAVISVEDVRFYKHEGLDYKRLFSAIVNTLRNADTHGGSTITQQLIKNKILTNIKSYKRKIQEAYLALELEKTIEKDDILVAYMNDVYLGESNYGVKAAAKDYFGKSLSELTIRECAMLAGMIQKPYVTNPRANTYTRINEETGENKMSVTNARTDTVINAMYDAGFITSEQRDSALKDTVYILEVSEQKQIYEMPYFVEYGIYDIVTHLLEKREMKDTTANRTAIETELRTGGYHIYLTVDPDVQNTVQSTLENWQDYPELADPAQGVTVSTGANGETVNIVQPQAAAVVLDYRTGELIAIVGGRTSPTAKKQWNRAYMSNMPVGSSIKPLAVYGPALDLGVSPATVIANVPGAIENYGGEKGYPALGSEKWMGPTTIRRGVTSSLNIVAARTLFEYVTPQVGKEYLMKMGIPDSRINADGPGLALGTTGITPIEMAAAYGTIGNGGTYIEPLSFSRVVDEKGEIIISADEVRKSTEVYKPSSCYMLIDMMTDVVNSGTGTAARIDGMAVAGKTGTNENYTSVYFAGLTPYYSASVWVGHDTYSCKLKKGSTGGKYAAPLWQAFMEPIHEGLANKPIYDVSPASLGLVQRTVCSVSGKLATVACEHDERYKPVTDWFYIENEPYETCDMHVIIDYCDISNEPAFIFCTHGRTQRSAILINSESIYRQFDAEYLAECMPNAILTDIPAWEYCSVKYEPAYLCSLHTPWYMRLGTTDESLASAIAAANQLISEVHTYLYNVNNLPATDHQTLSTGISWLQKAISDGNLTAITNYTEQLRYNFERIRSAYPLSVAP